jgi:crotonobetainyl-CoA:carnitine CoA-transferase CaiB-like acyl-CoA transferase
MTNQALSHLTVVEFASVLAGPLTGSFLAELGATVIKIENKNAGGDVTRNWRSKGESKAGTSAYYASANTYKKVVFLDLTNPTEKEEALELVKKADIVLTNFKHGSDSKLGLSFADFKAINPNIIHGQISGFANEHGRAAYDVVLQAETGFMSMNGQPDSLPTKMPVALIDILAAHQLKEGLLLALLKHQKNSAQHVLVNLEQAAISALANQASNWLMNGQVAKQLGSLHPNIAPYGETFLCADNKYVVLAIGSNNQFKALCHVLNLSEIANNNDYQENQDRVKNRNELQNTLAVAFKSQGSSEVIVKCNAHNIPIGLVKTIDEVLTSPAGQDMIIKEQRDNEILKKVKNVAFTISD